MERKARSFQVGHALFEVAKRHKRSTLTLLNWQPFEGLSGPMGADALKRAGVATRLELYCMQHAQKRFSLDPKRTRVRQDTGEPEYRDQLYHRLEDWLSWWKKREYKNAVGYDEVEFSVPLDREKKAIGKQVGNWYKRHGRPK